MACLKCEKLRISVPHAETCHVDRGEQLYNEFCRLLKKGRDHIGVPGRNLDIDSFFKLESFVQMAWIMLATKK